MKTALRRRWLPAVAAACTFAFAGAPAMAQQQGVTANEILIGTIQDLSGPIAAYGKQARQGMQMAIGEINERGGIHGRKLRLQVEDSAYDPRKAVLAAEKLVNQDRIFMMVAHIGTAHNLAAMPVQFEKNVINFLPLTSAREMYEPTTRLKYAFLASNFSETRSSVAKLMREQNIDRVCVLWQEDDYGREVVRGGEAALQAVGKDFVEKLSYKRGATDFSSQIAKFQSSNCQLVVLGTVIRETIGAITTARKLNYNPVFVGSSATYSDLIHKLGGKAVDGFYAPMTMQLPYLDEPPGPLRDWALKYKTQFGEEPGLTSVYGYVAVEMFAAAAAKAGKNLTTDTFAQAMDTLSVPPNIFGSAPMRFSATSHLGSDASRMSQIVDGRWKVISDYMK